MEAYTDFARVYDELMDETPYTEWSLFLVSRLRECGIMDGLVLDLGCGTGNMTELLYVAGYDMIGVDASADMLEQAVRKKEEARIDVLYLMQEMEAFELYGTVRAVVCCCDCVNYLTEPEALLRCFQLVNNYLDPDGVFLFDFNTIHKYRDEIGDTVIAENRDDCSFIWENTYDEDSRMNEYDLTLFIKEADDRYAKHTELHSQRAYELSEIKELLARAGLRFECAFDDYTENAPNGQSGRIVVLARECEKNEDFLSSQSTPAKKI